MRTMMSRSHGLSILIASLCLLPSETLADGWFLTVDGSMGRAHERLDTIGDEFDHDMESIMVGRGAIGCERHFRFGVVGGFELGLAERGTGFTRTTVFHPEGLGSERHARTYVDISSPWSYRLKRGFAFLGAGLNPRLSVLVHEPSGWWPGDEFKIKDTIPGCDPFLITGYKAFQVTARYLLDVGPSFDHIIDGVEVVDRSFLFGAGVNIPLN